MARLPTPPGLGRRWVRSCGRTRRATSLPELERRGVLVTRPEPDASATARRVAALGWEPVVAPVLRIIGGAVSCRTRFDAILVTSRNAIPALPEWYRHLPLLTVGSATASRARDAGFPIVVDADGDAGDLARLAR